MQFEESLISAKMEQMGDEEPDTNGEEGGDGEDFLLTDDGQDIDLRSEGAGHMGGSDREVRG